MKIGKNGAALKLARSLRLRKHREEHGVFLVPGVRFVEEALEAGSSLSCVFHTARLLDSDAGRRLQKRLGSGSFPVFEVPEPVLLELCDVETPQPVVAVASKLEPERDSFLEFLGRRRAVVLVLDRLQDPGNLGTIIRTAAGAGVTGVVTLPGTVDLYNPKCLRGTMGAIFRVPVLHWDGMPGELAETLGSLGLDLVATSSKRGTPCYRLDLKGRVALFVGSEAGGLDPVFLEKATHLARIPLPGRMESLNVAVAAGIMLYEVIRQRAADDRAAEGEL